MQTNNSGEKLINVILTKQGSKHLQKLLTSTPGQTAKVTQDQNKLVQFLVNRMKEGMTFPNLLMDQYGNYFCQKLFPRLSAA
jgi:hypothetical protein